VSALRADVHRVRAAELAARASIEVRVSVRIALLMLRAMMQDARAMLTAGGEAYALLVRQRKLDPATASTRARLLPKLTATSAAVRRLEQVCARSLVPLS
jgi:hypothetical protein